MADSGKGTNQKKGKLKMAKYQHFEELPVWQEAAKLYNATLDLLQQPVNELSGGFRGQLDRAALSVSNNIAEGFERATTGELLSFIAIARGSAGEVRSMISVVKGRPDSERCCFARTESALWRNRVHGNSLVGLARWRSSLSRAADICLRQQRRAHEARIRLSNSGSSSCAT